MEILVQTPFLCPLLYVLSLLLYFLTFMMLLLVILCDDLCLYLDLETVNKYIFIPASISFTLRLIFVMNHVLHKLHSNPASRQTLINMNLIFLISGEKPIKLQKPFGTSERWSVLLDLFSEREQRKTMFLFCFEEMF